MSMIFPGMDPYLESPVVWPDVHSSLIIYLRDQIRPHLRPRYVASVEERVYVMDPTREREFRPDVSIRRTGRERRDEGGIAVLEEEADAPDVVHELLEEVHENYVAILDLAKNQTVVTVIEVVSPTNKYAGPGRESYLAKQREVLSSDVHLVEIDLLRHGPHVLAISEWTARRRRAYDYLTCVSRADRPRNIYDLYPRLLRDRLPRLRVPLSAPDPDVVLDLQAALSQAHDAGDYRLRIRYDRPCIPSLLPADQAWADILIQNDAREGQPAP